MTDRAAAAAELWDRLLGLAERVEGDDWHRPTPCELWDVHDVVAHLPAIQHLFDGGPNPSPPAGWAPAEGTPTRAAWTEMGVVSRREWTAQQLLDDVRAARDGHVARLERTTDWDAPTPGPIGETTEDGLFRVRMMDLWVHLQDLRLALGQPVDAPDLSTAAEVAHRYLLGALPRLFAKRMDTVDGSTLRVTVGAPVDHDSVLHLVEGRTRWDDGADPAECSVTADPAAMTLLLTGRGTPESWRAQGLLDWSGDLGQQFVRRARVDV